MAIGRFVRILGFLAMLVIALAYAFRWEYRNPRAMVQIRTNRWTGATECLPSYTLLWTEVIRDKSGITKTGRTGGECSEADETAPGDWVCRPHRTASWGRCGD